MRLRKFRDLVEFVVVTAASTFFLAGLLTPPIVNPGRGVFYFVAFTFLAGAWILIRALDKPVREAERAG